MLVPNRDVQQRRIAQVLAAAPDGAVHPAPAVLMFSVWVEETAVRLRQLREQDVPGSLQPHSALMAWTRARSPGAAGPGGRAFEWSAARQARAADRTLRQWLEKPDELWLPKGFYQQRRRVREWLEAEGLFTAEDWLNDLVRQLGTGQELPLRLPREIAFRGFVEFTALECRLLESLERRGVSIDLETPGAIPDRAQVVAYQRPEDEWQAAARWAQAKLAAGKRSVCVVVPQAVSASGPSARRVRQIFAAVFHPGEAARLESQRLQDFYIPAAGSLAHVPAVADAMLLLRLSADGLDHGVQFPWLSQWLLSAHWGGGDCEAPARARLEWRLRDRGHFKLSLRDVARLAQREGLGGHLPELVKRVQTPLPAFASGRAGTWLQESLRCWGWPGARGGDEVVPHIERLQSQIERLEGLDIESPDLAVALLQSSCAETPVPFGGGPLSPVQVLAPEVAVGGRFDALWACHLDDAHWPPPLEINPYLPSAVRAAVPRLNPDGQLEYYRRLTAQLCAAAPEVRLSWSREAGEGPRMASGLISHLDWESPVPATGLRLSTSVWPLAGDANGDRQEWVSDNQGLAYPDEGAVELPGGADFFRLQAACPLMAYLRHRLKARFPAMPDALASPQFRGELMHQALRELYAGAVESVDLPSETGIGAAIDAALSRLHASERLTPTGRRAEAGRLRRLLGEWLALDRARSGFVVAALEEPLEANLGRANIRVRIDRIDRLADGRCLLMDYKSGKPGRSRALKWGLPRMQEPQLPLYAVLLESSQGLSAGALTFAIVKTGACGFDGISDDSESGGGAGIRVLGEGRRAVPFPDWASFRQHWHDQVHVLLGEILAGRADNRIYDAEALAYGDLALILRHDSASALVDEGTEDAR